MGETYDDGVIKNIQKCVYNLKPRVNYIIKKIFEQIYNRLMYIYFFSFTIILQQYVHKSWYF